MNSFKIGDFMPKLPIIQGGMGVGISMSGLASSVANNGGIGVISAACVGFMEKDFYTNNIEANIRALKSEIRKAKELTKGIVGVNIMVALSNFADMVKTSIEEKIDIIFSGAGLPLNLPEYLNGSTHTKLVPIVSSARAAAIIFKKWIEKYNYVPDAIVVEGPRAGGHLGFKLEQINDPEYRLEKIVVDVVDTVRIYEEKYNKQIPVIAGGGVYTGEDIYNIMKLGASGVQMATRFVTTDECDASIGFKNAYISCKEDDLEIIKSPVGMPGRAIRNKFLESVHAGEKKPYKCPVHCITTCDVKNSPYCISVALINAQKGNLEGGYAFAGSNAYRTDTIIPVAELMETLQKEYNEAEKAQN